MNGHPPSSILHPHRILVRGVNWLGDAVMTTPALARLRERFPEAHITLLTPEKLRDLWAHHPAVDDVIGFGSHEGLFSVSRNLRAGGFDLALVLPNSPRSALEVWLARIPQRVGYARPWRNWFLTQVVPTRPGHVRMRKRTPREIQELVKNSRVTPQVSGLPTSDSRRGTSDRLPASAHQLHEYLHLVAALGAKAEPIPPSLVVTAAEVQAAAQNFGLTEALTTGKLILGLNPGAEYGPAKRWPAEKFVAVANAIPEPKHCVWLVLGGKGDQSLANQICSALRTPHSALDCAGRTSLRELMALLKLCRVLLTNDTGPMHVAAALGTPVVVPFGSTSPELTGPGLPGDTRHRLLKSDAPCSPCFLRECPIDFRCMKGISAERLTVPVIQAAGSGGQ
jgi:heptosyltransferase-2